MLSDKEKIDIAMTVQTDILNKILNASNTVELREYLKNLGYGYLIEEVNHFDPVGKIYIIGGSQITKEKLMHNFDEYGINRERVELLGDYNKLTNFDFKSLQYSLDTACIMVGPIPHKGKGMGDYSSIIQMLREEDGYPDVIELRTESGELKITTSSLKSGIEEALERKVLVRNNYL